MQAARGRRGGQGGRGATRLPHAHAHARTQLRRTGGNAGPAPNTLLLGRQQNRGLHSPQPCKEACQARVAHTACPQAHAQSTTRCRGATRPSSHTFRYASVARGKTQNVAPPQETHLSDPKTRARRRRRGMRGMPAPPALGYWQGEAQRPARPFPTLSLPGPRENRRTQKAWSHAKVASATRPSSQE